eukprot:3783721-Amphidinium_carterae.2
MHRHMNDEQSEWSGAARSALSTNQMPKKAMVGMIDDEIKRVCNGAHVVFEGLPRNDVGVRAWRQHIEALFDEVRIYRVMDHNMKQNIAGAEFEQLCIERGCMRLERSMDVRSISASIRSYD